MNLPDIDYRPGWRFRLGGPGNRSLCVFAVTADTLHPNRMRTTQHMRELPPADVDFAEWLLDFVCAIEWHEAAEWLQIDGERPFWPGHAGDDPYAPSPVR